MLNRFNGNKGREFNIPLVEFVMVAVGQNLNCHVSSFPNVVICLHVWRLITKVTSLLIYPRM